VDKNWRSHPAIVDHSKQLLNGLTRRRIQKDMVSGWGTPPTAAIVGPQMLASESAEAEWVADETAILIDSGRSPQDIAVLYRYHRYGLIIEEAMSRRGIRCVTTHPEAGLIPDEVGDVMAFLRLVMDPDGPKARESFERVCQLRVKEVDPKLSSTIASFAEANNLSYLKAVEIYSEAVAEQSCRELEQLVRIIRTMHQENLPPAETISLLKRTQRLNEYYKTIKVPPGVNYEPLRKLSHLEEEARKFKSVAEFVKAQSAAGKSADGDTVDHVVHILTLHEAKGKEFPVVFLVGLAEGLFPAESTSDREEERRLCYVGMTRARELLYLSYPAIFNDVALQPSSFLIDARLMPHPAMHPAAAAGATASGAQPQVQVAQPSQPAGAPGQPVRPQGQQPITAQPQTTAQPAQGVQPQPQRHQPVQAQPGLPAYQSQSQVKQPLPQVQQPAAPAQQTQPQVRQPPAQQPVPMQPPQQAMPVQPAQQQARQQQPVPVQPAQQQAVPMPSQPVPVQPVQQQPVPMPSQPVPVQPTQQRPPAQQPVLMRPQQPVPAQAPQTGQQQPPMQQAVPIRPHEPIQPPPAEQQQPPMQQPVPVRPQQQPEPIQPPPAGQQQPPPMQQPVPVRPQQQPEPVQAPQPAQQQPPPQQPVPVRPLLQPEPVQAPQAGQPQPPVQEAVPIRPQQQPEAVQPPQAGQPQQPKQPVPPEQAEVAAQQPSMREPQSPVPEAIEDMRPSQPPQRTPRAPLQLQPHVGRPGQPRTEDQVPAQPMPHVVPGPSQDALPVSQPQTLPVQQTQTTSPMQPAATVNLDPADLPPNVVPGLVGPGAVGMGQGRDLPTHDAKDMPSRERPASVFDGVKWPGDAPSYSLKDIWSAAPDENTSQPEIVPPSSAASQSFPFATTNYAPPAPPDQNAAQTGNLNQELLPMDWFVQPAKVATEEATQEVGQVDEPEPVRQEQPPKQPQSEPSEPPEPPPTKKRSRKQPPASEQAPPPVVDDKEVEAANMAPPAESVPEPSAAALSESVPESSVAPPPQSVPEASAAAPPEAVQEPMFSAEPTTIVSAPAPASYSQAAASEAEPTVVEEVQQQTPPAAAVRQSDDEFIAQLLGEDVPSGVTVHDTKRSLPKDRFWEKKFKTQLEQETPEAHPTKPPNELDLSLAEAPAVPVVPPKPARAPVQVWADNQNEHGQPAYDQHAHGQTAYDQNAHGHPAYDQNAHGQTAYDQNTHVQPTYDQNTQGQLAYDQNDFNYAQQQQSEQQQYAPPQHTNSPITVPMCPGCGTPLEAGSRFCGECGYQLQTRIPACHGCGSPLEPSAKFCGECGSRRVDPSAAELESQQDADAGKPTQLGWMNKLTKFMDE